MLVPVIYLVIRAGEAGRDVWPLLNRPRTVDLFWNTFRLAAGVAVASIVIAVPYAWLVVASDLRWKRFWATLAPLPLVIPSYAGTIAMIGALGPRGLVQQWLEPLGVETLPSIYGYWGALATLTLFTYPYIFLSVYAALRRVDPTLEEASRLLQGGRWQEFRHVLLPQVRPAILAGSLLSVLYTVSDFGVVTLMRYDTFTRAIYTQYRSAFDRTLAAALSVILILFAVSLLTAEGAVRGRGAYHRLGTGAPRPRRPIPLGRWQFAGHAFCGLVVFASLGIPILTMLYWLATGSSAGHQLSDLPAAAGNSLLLAGLSALAIILCAFPAAMLAARYSNHRLSRALERLSYLGYALPGIVVALAFVFVGARYVPSLYQTLPMLIIAMTVKYCSQGVGMLRVAVQQVNVRYEESSRVLGAGHFATIRAITLPLISRGAGAALILSFLTVMKELPITLLLSPTGFETLATEIWSSTDVGSFGRAAAPSLLLIAISIVPTLLLTNRSGEEQAR